MAEINPVILCVELQKQTLCIFQLIVLYCTVLFTGNEYSTRLLFYFQTKDLLNRQKQTTSVVQ